MSGQAHNRTDIELGSERTRIKGGVWALLAVAGVLLVAGAALADVGQQALGPEAIAEAQPGAAEDLDLDAPAPEVPQDHGAENTIFLVCQAEDGSGAGTGCHTDSVQEAIDFAISGDSIWVADDATYEENLRIEELTDLTIDATVHGEATLAPPTTDVGIDVDDSEVTIEGLHLEESADPGIDVDDSELTWTGGDIHSPTGTALDAHNSDVSLSDATIVSEGPRAIEASGSHEDPAELTLDQVEVLSDHGKGIYASGSQVHVTDSRFNQTDPLLESGDTEYAVRLEGSGSDGSTFESSIFENHRHGVLSAAASDLTIEDNQFRDGGLSGVLVSTGPKDDKTVSGIDIVNNIFERNDWTGVGFAGDQGKITDITIEDNEFRDQPQHVDGTFYTGCSEDLSMETYFEANGYDRAVLGTNADGEEDPCKVESSIQEVLDQADDGHTVLVRGGIYEESLFVDDIQGLELKAFDDEEPVIDGTSFAPGTTLLELAPSADGTIADVRVEGFTFQNIPVHAGGSASSGHGIAMFTDHVIEDIEIVDNTFDNTEAEDPSNKGAAVVLDSVHGLTVANNTVREAADYTGAVPNEIAAVTLHMFLTDNSLRDVTVADNTIEGGEASAFGDRGIWVGSSSISSNVAHPNDAFENVEIVDNDISDIGREGIRVHAVADDGTPDEILIEDNTITNADRSIRIGDADSVTLNHNVIESEGDTSYGVSVETEARLEATGNTITGHANGLQVTADAAVLTSDGGTFEDNGVGLEVAADAVVVESNGTTFESNGVGVLNTAESFVKIRNATIADNDDGVVNQAEDSSVDARENYWNSPTGPNTDESGEENENDLPTVGDSIVGDVFYRDWCVTPDCGITATASVGVDL